MSKQTAAAAKTPAAPIRVRAIRMGYYAHKRRREGNVFTVKEHEFSATWMERVDGSVPESITTGQQALEQHRQDILASKVAQKSADPAEDSL